MLEAALPTLHQLSLAVIASNTSDGDSSFGSQAGIFLSSTKLQEKFVDGTSVGEGRREAGERRRPSAAKRAKGRRDSL